MAGTRRDLPDAVGRLLAERGRALTTYAYLLCGDVHDAEDLVQDALVKTYARSRGGVPLDSAEAYTRRAMLTLYVDGWRRRERWTARRHLLAGADAAPAAADDVAARADVMAALRTLPRRQRACVVLRFYADLTVAEIGEELGISHGAAKRYLSMGVHALEERLGALDGTGAEVELVEEVQP